MVTPAWLQIEKVNNYDLRKENKLFADLYLSNFFLNSLGCGNYYIFNVKCSSGCPPWSLFHNHLVPDVEEGGMGWGKKYKAAEKKEDKKDFWDWIQA